MTVGATTTTATTTTVRLPAADGSLPTHTLTGAGPWELAGGDAGFSCRTAFAAVHVVADPLADNVPGAPAVLDWDATLAHRRWLWAHGFAVAEAMDTAQRGMGLDWPTTAELIQRSAAEAIAVGGRIACGAGTDHAPPHLDLLDDVVAAYLDQVETVSSTGAQVIVMASRQLAALAAGPDDYAMVYDRVLGAADAPVVLHWLGPMFDPALAGYWGSHDIATATQHVLAIIGDHADRIDGIKVSLLDADHEVALRRALPGGVRLYTGDDFNYPELILGDEHGFSHALLGVFDAIAPAAAAALRALDRDDGDTYREILAPTVPLARHLFAAPTWFYKTGLTFVAWLAGHQHAFTMVGGLQSARGLVHLGQALRLADEAGLIGDPELAAARWGSLLALHGIEP
jgi:hypothetical protein